jgi:hypothetical protein
MKQITGLALGVTWARPRTIMLVDWAKCPRRGEKKCS